MFLGKSTWSIGDGIGGTWVRVGIVASKADCFAICTMKVKNGILANGATVDTKTGTNCYCEFGMTKRNKVRKWSSTFIIRSKFVHVVDSSIMILIENM